MAKRLNPFWTTVNDGDTHVSLHLVDTGREARMSLRSEAPKVIAEVVINLDPESLYELSLAVAKLMEKYPAELI